MENIFIELENRKGWKKLNGSVVSQKPTSGFLQWADEEGTPYYQNIQTGESFWTLPRQQSNSVSSLESALSDLRSECGAKDAKIAALEAKLKECGKPAASANNSGPAAKFKKMLKMGIPRSAVEQKMRMEGLEPSLLNASASASAVASNAAPAVRPMGGPMAGLLAGIAAGPKLKKVNTAAAMKTAAPEKPKNGKQSAAASIAEEAKKRAEERSKRATGSVEERLAVAKAEREAATAGQTKTGFAAFAAELKQRAVPTKTAPSAPIAKRQVLNANNSGPLPKGWKFVIDEDGDKYYVSSKGNSQWNRPVEGGRRRKSRRANHKSRRANRKSRRNN